MDIPGGNRWVTTEKIILETELEMAARMQLTEYLCPCRSCHGGRRLPILRIKQHLKLHRRDPFLYQSMLGGDPPSGYPVEGAWFADKDGDDSMDPEGIEAVSDHSDGEAIPLDQQHDVHQQFLDALEHADGMHEDVEIEEGAEDDNVCDDGSLSELEDLYARVSCPLYPGSKVSLISAVVVILTMCSTHSVTNVFVDELLKYL